MTDSNPGRYDLDEAMAGRTTIDARWSPRKKKLVGVAASLVGVTAISASVWWTLRTRPPHLPRTADEAMTVLASSRFGQLDEDRQRQYQAEASRLVRQLADEDRRALLRDEANREAIRKLWQARFDDIARRFARGEETPFGRFRPRGGRRGDRTARDPDRKTMTDQERHERRDQLRDRINEQIAQNAQTGNAQDSGLRAEMMKRVTAQRNAGGGGGGGGMGRRGG